MKNRARPPRQERPAPPAFTPVPRKQHRHDGWTPERQRAFIDALAETGSVTVACRMVNMSQATAYALRAHPQGGEFARAWEAAQAGGVQRLRDEAWDRAMNGQLVPLMYKGRVAGYRRVKNDRLLMYMLRHYGQDASGNRVVLNYFAPPPAAGTTDGGRLHAAPAPVPAPALPAPPPADPLAQAAQTLVGFEGVELDDQAQAAIRAALEACAARRRAAPPEADATVPFLAEHEVERPLFTGQYEFVPVAPEELPRKADEVGWESLDDHEHLARLDAAVASVAAAKARGEFDDLPNAAASGDRPAPATLPPPAAPPRAPRTDATWATPREQQQLADLDAAIEAAKAAAYASPPAERRRERRRRS